MVQLNIKMEFYPIKVASIVAIATDNVLVPDILKLQLTQQYSKKSQKFLLSLY
jgi:hypothetical protein